MALPHRSLTLLSLGIALMCLSTPSLAKDFYKWQDADGITHYSSKPSNEYKSVKVRASNIQSSDTSTEATNRTSIDEVEKTESTTTANTAQNAERSKDPERCATAQKNRQTLDDNARIRMKDGDEFRYLTPEEIQQQKDTADQIIAEEC